MAKDIVRIIVRMKRENPLWGAARLRLQLRWLGIQVSEPTIQTKLRNNGFDPSRGPRFNFDHFRSRLQDVAWAMDFFVVKNARGLWSTVFVTIDLHTRELIDLRAKDGWFPDAVWTIRAFAKALHRTGRTPERIVHDRGGQFFGQFMRQASVLEIEQRPIPPCFPVVNGIAERVIKTIRMELTNHLRPRSAEELQQRLDVYLAFYNEERAHQGIDGATPSKRDEGGPDSVPVLSLAEIRKRKLVRKAHISSLLNSYSWELDEAA